MLNKIRTLQDEFDEALTSVSTLEQVKKLRVVFLGRKGSISALMKELKNIPSKEKAIVGKEINLLKNKVESGIKSYNQSLSLILSYNKIYND